MRRKSEEDKAQPVALGRKDRRVPGFRKMGQDGMNLGQLIDSCSIALKFLSLNTLLS